MLVLDAGGGGATGDVDFDAGMERADDEYEMADTLADDPAQLYYSSGTTGKAKGILHAHRYLLAHEEFEFCHDVRDGELFHGSGEWAWAAGIAPLLGPVALWRGGLVQARKGGYDPEEHLRFLSKRGVENMFTTPTALRAMTGVSDAGKKYSAQFRAGQTDRSAHSSGRRGTRRRAVGASPPAPRRTRRGHRSDRRGRTGRHAGRTRSGGSRPRRTR